MSDKKGGSEDACVFDYRLGYLLIANLIVRFQEIAYLDS